MISDIANADDNPMSRRKSLKKSLRESFRRLRKGRSQRNIDKKKGSSTSGNTTADPIKKELPKFRYLYMIFNIIQLPQKKWKVYLRNRIKLIII